MKFSPCHPERKYYAHNLCKMCYDAKRLRAMDREKYYSQHILGRTLRRHRLTVEGYENLYYKQKGLCLICDIPLLKHGSKTHVDHNHATQKIRGLLCTNCNTGLGLFSDSTSVLYRAIKYLQERGSACG